MRLCWKAVLNMRDYGTPVFVQRTGAWEVMPMYKLVKKVLRIAGDLKPRILLGFVFGFLEALFNILPLIAIFY